MTEFLLFSAEWSKPSKDMLQMISELLPAFSEATITEVTLEKEPERHANFAIRQYPTLVAMINGEEVKRAHSLDLIETIEFVESVK